MMYHRNCVGVVLLGFIVAVSAMAAQHKQPATQATTATDEAKIRDVIEHHVMWFNAGDWKSIGTEFTDDAVAMIDSTPNLTGKEALTAFFRDELAQFAAAGVTVKLAATVDEAQVFADWALVRATFSPTFINGDKQSQHHVRFMLIFRKQADGSWKIARFMTNSPPVAAPGPQKASATSSPNPTPSESLPTVDQILKLRW